MPKKAHFAGVQRVKQRDAKGAVIAVRNYHRATKTRLPDDYGSPAFAVAWAKAESSAAAINRPIAPRETYAGLCKAFTADDNPDWTKLAANTQRDYRKCMAWMSRQGADPRPAAGLEQERCEILLDKAVRELGHRQGVYVLQFNRRLYGWVLERAARQRVWGDKNPWAKIATPAKPRAPAGAIKRNRVWKPEEVVEVLFAAPIGLRRAYVLGVSGLDGSTMVGLTWDDWNEKEGGFAAERLKTGTEGYINVLPLFRMFLEEGERPSTSIVTNQLGQPFKTANTLQTRSSDFLAGLAKKGLVGPGLTLHGLRHTLGKAVAEVGGTLGAIQMALQHATPAMSLHYSAAADKKRALRDTTSALENWFGLSKAENAVSKTTH
jgi:integrase